MSNRNALVAALASLALAVGCAASTGSTGDLVGGFTEGDAGNGSTSSSSSSSSSGGGNHKDAGSGSTSSSGGSSTSGGTSSGGSSTSGGSSGAEAGTAACGGESTADACTTCCVNAHQQGAQAGEDAFGNCVCTTPGSCKTECAQSFCNGQDPQQGDACDTCLQQQGQGACGQTADQACQANPDCVAFEQCVQQAGCDTKP